MSENREVITGSDFKRMITGAYSEVLLEYENINALGQDPAGRHSKIPGTHVLRTLGAAALPIADTKDESIGGLAQRVAYAALLGARGNAGVVLAQLFRGIAKGLNGKYNATSSEFGKAFQYGILYVQRVFPEDTERPIIRTAKAIAKGAYHAVRQNLPISEILAVAKEAGEKCIGETGCHDAGEKLMVVFINGCLKGLDGNFVSPTVSFGSGYRYRTDYPDPRNDKARPYCVSLVVDHSQISAAEAERQLKDYGDFIVTNRRDNMVYVHLHTDHPGGVLEQVVGWGHLKEIHVNTMAEPHAMAQVRSALLPVAVLTVAAGPVEAKKLQDLGASVILEGDENECPSVADVVNAAHSDFARSYVLLSNHRGLELVFRQAKRILGGRVELVLATDKDQQVKAMKEFDLQKSVKENAAAMRKTIGL